MASIQKITPFLWFESQGQEAAAYYVSVFPEAKIIDSNPLVTTFELFGQRFATLNGGPHHQFNDSISLMIDCKDQAEVDYYWDKFITDGGKESQCGWLKDKYGLSWQIVPEALPKLMMHPDQEKAGKAMQAMLKMRKIVVAELEAAFNS
jgi:predicted 3-demethylubiquinone-9 3-methyltransferase (glyoxalase superfamily)